jgi:hypothetical protein
VQGLVGGALGDDRVDEGAGAAERRAAGGLTRVVVGDEDGIPAGQCGFVGLSPGKHAPSGALGSPTGPRWRTTIFSSPGTSEASYPGMLDVLGTGSEVGQP